MNGKSVCFGPARGDLMHWPYETVDLAPYLVPSKNVLAVMVHHYDEAIAPVFQMSAGTGLLLQGRGESESVVNTLGEWKVWRETAYSARMEDTKAPQTYRVVGPSEDFGARKHPRGWLEADFNDSVWPQAEYVERNYAAPYGHEDGHSH